MGYLPRLSPADSHHPDPTVRLLHPLALVMGFLLLLPACDPAAGGPAPLETDDQKASYAIGRDMGSSLQPAAERLDVDALARGIREALAGEEAALSPEELQAVLQEFTRSIQADQMAAREEEAQTNRAEGEAFMEENAEREGVTTTESGLQYEVVEPGDGPTPGPQDRVRVHYRGTLVDGTEFDSSYERGEPAVFGLDGVIPGFSEGLQLMEVGSTYRFVIPGELAYGPQGGGGGTIGPDETLVFEVELLGIEE